MHKLIELIEKGKPFFEKIGFESISWTHFSRDG